MHGIVALAYNNIEEVKEFIKITYLCKEVDKIVIVDNCSNNNLYYYIKKFINEKKFSDKVDIIKTIKNGGYAYGNNIGIKYLQKKYNPEYISVANTDIILSDKSIQCCKQFLEHNANAGIVAPLMISMRNEPMMSFWKQPSIKDIIIDNLIIFNRIKKKRNDKIINQEKNVLPVDVISGSFFMAKTELYTAINYLDPDTFLYSEENILSMRIKNINHQNYVLNNCNYIHNHSQSINKNITSVSQRMKILHQSYRVYIKKYLYANKIQLAIFETTYTIGKFVYLMYIKLFKIKR